jgi:hypothetical protein
MAMAATASLTGPARVATDSALAERLLRGFATCAPDAAAYVAREALLQRGTPAEKTEAYWRHTVDFMEIRVRNKSKFS